MKLLPVAITLSLFAVLFAATGRTSSSAAYDPTMPMQQTYELRCRGGGLKFNSTSGKIFQAAQDASRRSQSSSASETSWECQ